jgi:hypothetical protein
MVTAQQIEAARRDYVAALGTPSEMEKWDALVRLVAIAKREARVL